MVKYLYSKCYDSFRMGWRDLRPWLRWTIGIFAYLLVGPLIILLFLYSLGTIPAEGWEGLGAAIMFIFLCACWITLGVLLILIFGKAKQYWLKGMLLGIFVYGVLIVTSVILRSPAYARFMGKLTLDMVWTTWPLWALVGAIIGYIIGKPKKSTIKSYF